jgi:hypothetical protein
MSGDGLVAYLEDLRAAVRPAFNVSVIKHAMELVGLAVGPVRPPLLPVDTATGAAVASMIRAWEYGLGWLMSAGVAVTSVARSVRSIPPIRGTEVDMA